MAMLRAPFGLALVAVAAALLLVVVSSCHASREHPDIRNTMAVESSKTVVILDDPKCEVMEKCDPKGCTDYCIGIGLGQNNGFCTFHDLQFYCCCPID
uniref:Knottin scorpion toxin-like domain-containing protein n=1 Tax=Oryza barthii TaxID=65489 RepID=A0A0D3FBY9_9ORYZ